MRHRFGRVLVRGARVLAGLVLVAGVIPGCGDNMSKEEAAGGIPPVLKESNDNMENFMKSQSSKSKSKQAEKPAKAEAPEKAETPAKE